MTHSHEHDDTDYPIRKQRALIENPHGLTFEEAMEAFFHYFTQAGRNELNDYLAHDMVALAIGAFTTRDGFYWFKLCNETR